MQFIVAGFQPCLSLQGSLKQFQPDVVGKQAACRLERVLGRKHQPHLIQCQRLQQLAGKGYVSRMDGIEGASKQAYFPLSDSWGVGWLMNMLMA